MGIIKSSLIFKLISGFFVACKNSRIGMAIGNAFKGSNLYKIFFEENNKMIEYANHSKLLGNRRDPKPFSIDKEVGDDQVPKYLSWLYSSFFFKMIITWKDCEQDDQYT